MIFNFKVILIGLLILIGCLSGETALNDSIDYKADYVSFDRRDGNNVLILKGNSWLKYQSVTLTAHEINYNTETGKIYATFIEDTIYTAGVVDSVKIVGLPTLVEGNETVYGKTMEYDVNTKRGKVFQTSSTMKAQKAEDNLYVKTETIYRMEDNTICGLNGSASGCDHEEPHYSFKSDSMFVDSDNWVYVKPVYFYIGKIPLGYAPYAFYKRTSGRSSGIILPSYNYTSRKGNGIKELGFFYDISDYVDYTAYINYYDFAGFFFKQNLRIRKRYEITGNLKTEYLNDYKQNSLRLIGDYNHIITPTTKLDLKFDYVTRKKLIDNSEDYETDKLKKYLYSGGEFSKRWIINGDVFSASSTYKQFLDTARTEFLFPSLRYSYSSRSLKDYTGLDNHFTKNFKISGNAKFSKSGIILDDKNEFSDNNAANFSFSESYKISDLTFSGSHEFLGKHNETRNNILFNDNINQYTYKSKDSTDYDYGFKHKFSISYKHSVFKYLKLEERYSLQYDNAFRYQTQNLDLKDDWASRYTYDLNLKANTAVYGIFQPEYGFLYKVRHSILPTVNFNYNPDFTRSSYDYFYTTRDSLGRKILIDKFKRSIVGPTTGAEALKMSFDLSNLVDFKLFDNLEKNTSFEHQFFNHKMSFVYNFLEDTLKFSNLKSNSKITLYRGKIVYYNFSSGKLEKLNNFDLDITGFHNQEFSFYNSDKSWIGIENYFLRSIKENYGYEISVPLRFSTNINEKMFSEDEKGNSNLIDKKKSVFTDIPMEFSSNLRFSQSFGDNGYSRTFNLDMSASVDVTENWKLSYRGSFNFNEPGITTSSSISVHRDIHCFEGDFSWDLDNQGFSIIIKAKSSLFRDLKWEEDSRKYGSY